MSLFWKKKSSDDGGDEDDSLTASNMSREERIKESAQSWLNSDASNSDDDAEDAPSDSEQRVWGKNDFWESIDRDLPRTTLARNLDEVSTSSISPTSSQDAYGSSNSFKTLEKSFFDLIDTSVGEPDQIKKVRDETQFEAELFDLDSQLFKRKAQTIAEQEREALKGENSEDNTPESLPSSEVNAFPSLSLDSGDLLKGRAQTHVSANPRINDDLPSLDTPLYGAETNVASSGEKQVDSDLSMSFKASSTAMRTEQSKISAEGDRRVLAFRTDLAGISHTATDKANVTDISAANTRMNPRLKVHRNPLQNENDKTQRIEPSNSVSSSVNLEQSSKASPEPSIQVRESNDPVITSQEQPKKRISITPKAQHKPLTSTARKTTNTSDDSISTAANAPEGRGRETKDHGEAQSSPTVTTATVKTTVKQVSVKPSGQVLSESETPDQVGTTKVNVSTSSTAFSSEKQSSTINTPSEKVISEKEVLTDSAAEQSEKHKRDKWQLEKIESIDPLLDCLVSLSKHFDNPYTADGIISGLPISNRGMTPDLFMRAAKRIGLVTRFVKRPIAKISHVLLPVVLLLEDNQACVLLEINTESDQAKVFMPESGEGEVYLPLSHLRDAYTGYCFFIRPQFRFDKRSNTAEEMMDENKHWFWATITSSWRIYRDVIIASLLINIFALSSPLFVMNVYDRVVPNNAFETLWVLAIGATVVYLFDFVLRTLRSYFIDVAGKKSDILISANIFSRVNNIKMASRPRSIGAFAKNLQDFDSIRDFITSASIATLVDIPFMFLIMGIIYLIGGPIAIIPIITILSVVIYSMVIQRPLRRSIEEGQKTSMQKSAVLIESLANAESVKLNNAQGTLQQQWEQAVGNIADWGLKTRQLAQSCSSFAMVMQQLTTVAMVILGVYMIAEHEMSMGALVACVMLTGRALGPMSQFAALAARYNHAKSAFKGLSDIMASPVEQPDDMKFVHRPRFEGSFEFEGVSFSYPESEQDAVTDINIKIKAGEKVAIIGRIGSGKTTLGKLMMGLYAPKDGALRIDGIDLRQVNPVDLRRNVGAVSQDVSLFYGSIKDNISFGVPYIEDEAIIRAADLSGVSEFANRRASGLDSNVGERGLQLSGGQRQSVAIARAVLFDPNILVLDEPTASMDNTTEARMRKRLADIMDDKTLILITHKSSMLELVDRVIVMDNGRVLADGSKEHVLEALRQGKLKVS